MIGRQYSQEPVRRRSAATTAKHSIGNAVLRAHGSPSLIPGVVGHFSHGCKLEDCIGFHGEENRRESSAWNVTAGAVAAIGPTRVFSASFGVRVGYGSTLQFKCVALKSSCSSSRVRCFRGTPEGLSFWVRVGSSIVTLELS